MWKKRIATPSVVMVFFVGTKPMVNHDQKRVEAIRKWKICDEVIGDLLEQASGNRANRSKGENSRLYVGFILLANGILVNILTDKSCKTRPPEFGGNQLASLQIARMAGGLMVMAVDKNGFVEGKIGGNVDTAFVG